MINTRIPLLVLCTTAISFTACGLGDEGNSETVVEYVKLQVASSLDEAGCGDAENPPCEGGEIIMTAAECENDSDTGFFSGRFTGSNGVALDIKVKGFSTTPNTYTCTQATDNAEDAVGNKFDSCSVSLSLADPETSVNRYAMHREVDSEKPFNYTGTCTLTTTYDEPRLNVDVACSNLIQTDLQGAPRNPIDESVTVSIETGSTFFCDL
ncbi:MAG: hypothetical protein VYA30_16645 [Myxococcota bacterium]|nr:hypothetical protein [Myxococcota bacterium]